MQRFCRILLWASAVLLAWAPSRLVVRLPDGSTVELSMRAIGGYSAVALPEVVKLWKGRAELSPNGMEVRTPEGSLQAAPRSFFLRWQSPTRTHTSQLPVPVQSDGTQLYVPVQTLIELLSHVWETPAVWVTPAEVHFQQRVSAEPRPASPATPRIAPLPIPPDTGFSPRLHDLPYGQPDDTVGKLPPRGSRLLAAFGTSFALAPTEIVSVELSRSADTIRLLFHANGTIERYQRPEWHGHELVVRIPEVLHTAERLPQAPEVEQFHVQRIRDITVYRIRFRSPVRQCLWSRRGPRTLEFSVLLETGAKSAWGLDVIVLDPGHGGQDYGTIGVNGVAEKDITLRVALKLRQLLQRMMPEVQVILTREDDYFVPLYRRGQIANENRGKLFISLHCNAAPVKPHPARGIETYVLRPERTPEAVRVAERENAVIRFEADPKRYEKLAAEYHIVATLAQSAFLRLSDRLAALLQQELVAATGLPDRGVGQAGFYVLMGASMPAVLVEMGFLSHPQEARFLSSEKGQWKIARGLARALQRYAAEYADMLH